MCVGKRGVINNSFEEYNIPNRPMCVMNNFEKFVPMENQHVDAQKDDIKEFKHDALAIMTQQTKQLFQWINGLYQNFLHSIFYK